MSINALIGCSQAIRQVQEDVASAAKSDAKVLLTGESGVGKEIVARLIHDQSHRSRNPMVPINCAGIPDSLLASELFGHVRGSFTDAHRDSLGWLGQANHGTAFLDEVGEMSLQMQALLLRFLETGELQRVGSEGRSTKVNVRIVCATNRQLSARVKSGEFREDLFYRLNVIHIEMPSLRQRPDDVPILFEHFVINFSAVHRMPVPVVTPEAARVLARYRWPGNVRELKNVAERMVLRCRSGEITPMDLPREIMCDTVDLSPTRKTTGQSSRAHRLFEQLTMERQCFWTIVHMPFMTRDLTREDLRDLVRAGLTATHGSYRGMLQLFGMPPTDYKRLLTFLRKHQVHLPIHEFRNLPVKARLSDREALVVA